MTYAGEPTVPAGGDRHLGPAILAAIWTLLGVSTVVLLLRFFSQFRIQRRSNRDDYVMILAWICQVICCGMVSYGVHWGLGRHAYYLSPEQRKHAVKWEYIGAMWGIIAPTFGRISYALFLLTFLWLLTTLRRIFLWVLIISQLVVNVLMIIIALVQCNPTARLWDADAPGSCWSVKIQADVGFFQGAVNTLTDLVLTVVALTVVLHLNVRMRTKVVLGTIMSLSSIAMVGSIIKTVELKNLEHAGDFTYDTAAFVIWYSVENNIVMIAASVPKVRPLFAALHRKRTGSRERRETTSSDLDGNDEENNFPTYQATQRRRRRSTLSRLKFAWDPKASRLSRSRDSGYSSSEPGSVRSYNNESVLTSASSMNRSPVQPPNPPPPCLRREERPSQGRRTRYGRSNSISLATLSRASSSSRKKKKKKMHKQSHSMSTTSHGSHLRPFSPASVHTHSHSHSANSNTLDHNSLLSALSNQSRGKTTISAGGPVPPSVPSTVAATPVPDSGRASRASMENGLHENEYTGPWAIPSVGPFCIWRTREYTIQYEESDKDQDSTTTGGPGPSIDEAAVDGLKLYDAGGVLGESSNNNDNNNTKSRNTDPHGPVPTSTPPQPTYDEAAADGLELFDAGGILSGSSNDNSTKASNTTSFRLGSGPGRTLVSPQSVYDEASADGLELFDVGGILSGSSNDNSTKASNKASSRLSSGPGPTLSSPQSAYDEAAADRLELSDVGGILSGSSNDTTNNNNSSAHPR